MKCPHCGGRDFRVTWCYVVNVEYDKNDVVILSDIDEYLEDVPNSHYCVTCQKDVKDDELIAESIERSKK